MHLLRILFVFYMQLLTKLLRNFNAVAAKLDSSRIPCASPAAPHQPIKEAALRFASTEMGGRVCGFVYGWVWGGW